MPEKVMTIDSRGKHYYVLVVKDEELDYLTSKVD